MYLWCDNCQETTPSLSGKYDIRICHQCGCEVRCGDPLESARDEMVTASLSLPTDVWEPEHSDAMQVGWDQAESIVSPEDQALETARFLPGGFYEEEAALAEEVADLDETWEADRLLEKIQKLEQTIRPRASKSLSSTPRKSTGKMQLRVDQGHVTTESDLCPSEPPTAAPLSDTTDLPVASPLEPSHALRIDAAPRWSVPQSTGKPEWTSRPAAVLALAGAWAGQVLFAIAATSQMSMIAWCAWIAVSVIGSTSLMIVVAGYLSRPETVPGKSGTIAAPNTSTSSSGRLARSTP